MGGGLMQLVAYGAQDVYLTGNPQITFFKVVYRRHTNFSMEAIEQTFNGTADFGKKVSATISRNGDLVTNMYVEIGLPAAIGCGELIYDRLSSSSEILLDCKNHQIIVLEHKKHDEYIEQKKIYKSLGYIK